MGSAGTLLPAAVVAEGVAEADDGRHHGVVGGVEVEAGHERAVDLERRQRQVLEDREE
jgi:hypothetical protein